MIQTIKKMHFAKKNQLNNRAGTRKFVGLNLWKKRLIRKVNRVPINLMAEIQRGDLRGTNLYERGILGTKEIKAYEGKSLDEYDIHNFYSDEQILRYIKDLVEGRRSFTDEIASESLREEILRKGSQIQKIFQFCLCGVKTPHSIQNF